MKKEEDKLDKELKEAADAGDMMLMDEIIVRFDVTVAKMKEDVGKAIEKNVNDAQANVTDLSDTVETAINEKYAEWDVKTKLFSFSKKVDIKLKEAAVQVEKVMNEKLDDEELELALVETERLTGEFDTWVKETVIELEDPVNFEFLPIEVKDNFIAVVEQTKSTALNKTEGIKVQTNIGNIKVDANKKIKELQTEITDKMLR